MENYKHILLAVDFYEHCEAVANRAKDLANRYQAKLSIIHVVDLPITDAGYGTDNPFNMDLTTELMAGAKRISDSSGSPRNTQLYSKPGKYFG